MSNSNIFVSKVQINNKTKLYLKLQWIENDVDLFLLQILCNDGKGWSGAFTNELAQNFIDDLYQSKENYYTNTKKCLTGEGGDEYILDLHASDDGNTAKFTWKKKHESFFQVQGSFTLNRDDNSVSMDTFTDFLINENKALKNTIQDMHLQNVHMNAEIMKCRSELEKFAEIKTSVETTLYGKFVQLLNSKKQKIETLEKQLKKYMNVE